MRRPDIERTATAALFAVGTATIAACSLIAGLQPAELIQEDAGSGAATSSTAHSSSKASSASSSKASSASSSKASSATTSGTGGASCSDGVQDGMESDIDCGGPVCDAEGKTCAFGKKCKADADCTSCFCIGVTCGALTLGTAANAVGVAVDATSVYWTDMGGGIVAKAPNGGGGPSFTLAFSQSSPEAIALDAMYVYWTTVDAVMRVAIDGGPSKTLASGQTGVQVLAVDPTSAYWNVNGGTGSSVVSAPKGGGMPTYLASGMWHSAGIAVDSTNVYWTTNSSVMKATIGVGNASTIASTDVGTAIAVNGGSVYWTGLSGQMATISTAPTDGDGGAEEMLAGETSTAAPLGIAVDSASVYWTDSANGTVMKAPIGGGTATTLASGQDTPSGITLDATYVYWAGGTAVYKICK